MKKFLSLILIFVMAFSFSACPDNPSEKKQEEMAVLKLLTGEDHIFEWNSAYEKYVAQVSYPVIKLDEKCSGRYPELNKKIESINREFEKEGKKIYKDLYDSGIEMLSNNPEYFVELENSDSVYVRCVNEKIVSMLFVNYSYMGGAHPNTYHYSKNLDTETGDELMLSDVVTDVDLLGGYVADKLYEEYDYEMFFSDLNETIPSLFNDGFNSWTLDNTGLTLYFSPYVLASYAAGSQIVTLPKDEYPDLFNQKYLPDDEAFSVELRGYEPMFYDIDGDGDSDKISVYEEYNYEIEAVKGIKILVNDVEYSTKCGFSYESVPMFIHTKNGDNLIYIETASENDYRRLYCYNLSTGKPQFVGELDWGIKCTYMLKDKEKSDYYVLRDVLSGPDDFTLEKNSSVLSTVTIAADFSVSRSMLPKTNDKIYKIINENKFEFTMLKSIDAVVYDEQTNKTGESVTLKKGDKVEYYAVDDKHHAYLKLKDSSIVRIEVNDSGWPRTVDGTDIERIFDGLMFAG